MMKIRLQSSAAFILLFLISLPLIAQGPRAGYYFHPATVLPWADCRIAFKGGSEQKLPFLPVILTGLQRAPLGTDNYSQDIRVEAPLVFAGNGIFKKDIWDCYRGRRDDYTIGEIDLAGKAVLFCYDSPDKIQEKAGKDVQLNKRIAEAAARKAAAVVLFSFKDEYPFLMVSYDREEAIPRIPAISITRAYASSILQSAGLDAESLLKQWEETGNPPDSSVLITRLRLTIKGAFDKVETKNFVVRFRAEEISRETMQEIADVNEKSLGFLFGLFKDERELRWRKLLTVYFSDYDSKLFYTHHWGSGLASSEGVFMVHRGGVPDIGLAAHENAHILTRLNWGDSTSFMNEGVGKYAEAMAAGDNRNNLQTVAFLKENKLFPLEDMLGFQIGINGLKTDIGYPAAGSFVDFLIRSYGLQAFKEAFRLENRNFEEKASQDTWQKAYRKSIQDLEKEWLTWLVESHKVDKKYLEAHLEKVSQAKKSVELSPELLDSFVGEYELPQVSRVSITKKDSRLFIQLGGLETTEIVPESENNFKVKGFDANLMFIRDEKGGVSEIVVNIAGSEMRGKKIKSQDKERASSRASESGQ
jgi:hypothetical protein